MEDHVAPPPLTSHDHPLLLAARAWASTGVEGLWDVFPVDRRNALRWAWNAGFGGDSASAREQLRREHEAQVRPDLARVHPSWWVRALKEEPASVRATVVAGSAPFVTEELRHALGIDPVEDLAPDRIPHPLALRAALALWTERLVGDVAERSDDPPVVVALARLDGTTLTRLIQTAGLAKQVLAGATPADLDPGEQTRVDALRERLAAADPRFRQVAARDVRDLPPALPKPAVRLGLITLARLLVSADPFRARWALQHIPYATARTLRTLMGPPGRRNPMLARWEADMLRAAWLALAAEGRLDEPWTWGTPT